MEMKVLCYKTMIIGLWHEIDMIEIYLTDENHQDLSYEAMRSYFVDAAIWAEKHCASYKKFHIQDVSDVSLVWDQVAEYVFEDERDVMWFKLKWG